MIKFLIYVILTIYYSICCLPLLIFISKNDIYKSFCYFNYLISKLFYLEIYYNKNLKDSRNLILSNHQSIYDILIGFNFQIYNNNIYEFCLKKAVSLVPGIGWWCKILNFPILDRNKSDIQKLKNLKSNNSIIIYPEGTRINQKKYNDSVEFAKKNGILISKYSLIPKSTGAYNILSNNKIDNLTFSFIFYLDKNNKLSNKISTFNFPKKVFIYNKSYSKNDINLDPNEFKSFIQKEFYLINEIVNYKFDQIDKKLKFKLNLKMIFLVIFVLFYPFLIYLIVKK